MKIVATDKRLRVDFKVKGKQYDPSAASEGQPGTNNATYSTYPFDSVDVEIGKEFDQSGVDVVRVVEYTEHAEQSTFPTAE